MAKRAKKKRGTNLRRIERLIQLLRLLQGGRPRNVESLATECGVTRRTIFRDLDTFRRCGLDLVFDEDQQGYVVNEGHFLPPTNFTPDEALALIVLSHEIGDRRQLPFYDVVRTAAIKLENNLPPGLREELRNVVGAVHIDIAPRNQLEDHHGLYNVLIDALATRRCVRIQYSPPAGQKTFGTKLSPYQLMFSRRSWYVIGRSSLHRAKRTFNLGRITKYELLDDKFKIPKGFTIEKHLRNAWHMIPEPGPDSKVVVRFDPLVADNVAEVTWHKTQKCRRQADGSLRFEVTVSGLWEISWWIMGYGEKAEVLQPAKLRKMIAQRALAMVQTYKK